ncbi:helix-turn-helix domain-containing protein [Streptomyces sp. ET3-23]|uniref:helix-turn-helix domain-containing protein n=1 Tax=Streptomyces sp. ET3-23 TaxID=2885643 RepID=UPI001D122390|nr:helix-turn-helix transcriptional regulator [Streptomyces sp. ET3-23]MCC2276160.1 helix-turn-helix domain-containing protein [Streptomyces sp. ET3-23]
MDKIAARFNVATDHMRRGGKYVVARARPTARRIELGAHLRHLRESVGLTIEDAARGMPFSETKVQRVETGLQSFRQARELRKLLERYGVTEDDAVEQLLEIQREASSQEWWTEYKDVMPSGMQRFVGIESAAKSIHVYHPTLVHGLLQTEAYARAVHEVFKPVEETTTEFVDKHVALRMGRKETLLAGEEAPRLWVILGEGALRWVIGGSDVMCEQYDEIVKLAALDNITVQVLPFQSRGYRATHDFALLDPGDGLPQMVQADTAWGAVSVTDKPREVKRFARSFDALRASALPPEDTQGFLHRLTREITQ